MVISSSKVKGKQMDELAGFLSAEKSYAEESKYPLPRCSISSEDSETILLSDDSASSTSLSPSTPRSSLEMSDASMGLNYLTSSSPHKSRSNETNSNNNNDNNINDNNMFDTPQPQSSSPIIPRTFNSQPGDWSFLSFSNSTKSQHTLTTCKTSIPSSSPSLNKQSNTDTYNFPNPRRLLFEKGGPEDSWKIPAYDHDKVKQSSEVMDEHDLNISSVEILKDTKPLRPQGTYQVELNHKYGSGAWSNVYRGTLTKEKDEESKPDGGLIIAVKRPLNANSIPTLKHEAQVLTHIHKQLAKENDHPVPSIIPFHGFDIKTNSILLTAYPGEQFNDFINRHAQHLIANPSNTTLRLPVIGIRQWIFMSERLVDALSFLKSNGIVHGDIKPHNILLRQWMQHNESAWWSPTNEEEKEAVLVEPLISDFTSSRFVRENDDETEDEEPISAVTTTYCAPELLTAFLTPPATPKGTPSRSSLKLVGSMHLDPPEADSTPKPIPTFSSDVYSLAITLLQAGIGSHPYSEARMDIQKNMWVRQGDPLSFARADERAFRCQKGGIVARLVKGCFGKTDEQRTTIEEMRQRITNMGSEWRAKQVEGNKAWVWGK